MSQFVHSRAIVDASDSTDDAPKEELNYKWELLEVPLDYEQPALAEEPTLTLDGLTAGRYTVQVTVTDADGASDATTAKIVVEEEKDNSPTANAGWEKADMLYCTVYYGTSLFACGICTMNNLLSSFPCAPTKSSTVLRTKMYIFFCLQERM